MSRGPVRRILAAALMAGLTATLGASLAACTRSGPVGDDALRGQRSAALARLIVDNRTDDALAIAFRYVTEPDGEVEVGTAVPGALTETAPIPAAEPILLIARAPGVEYRVGPRSLEIDEVWTWVIEADTASHGW